MHFAGVSVGLPRYFFVQFAKKAVIILVREYANTAKQKDFLQLTYYGERFVEI